MPLRINFDKARGLELLAAVKNGTAITLHTVHDLLAMASVCWCAVFDKGPELQRSVEQPGHTDHVEAHDDRLPNDIDAAIHFYATLFTMLQDGEYDAAFEREVSALAWEDAAGEMQVRQVEGFREEA